MAGRVTALESQKRGDRVSVFLDGRFAFGLPAIVAARLAPGQHLSDEEIAILREKGTTEEAYDTALNYLSYRPRSTAEVVAHLQRHGVPETQIAAVTGRLERAGLLGDEAFARYWVENRGRFRPRGRAALRHELRAKGISEEVLGPIVDQVDVSEGAYAAAARQAQRLRHLDRPEFRRKLIEFLARRGFDYDVAREAADRHWTQITETPCGPAPEQGAD